MTTLDEAKALAEELFADADEVDRLPVLPRERLDRFAHAGLYGLSVSGIEMQDGWPIVAALAGGCLTTTFVWMQHLGAARAGAALPGFEGLATGELRSTAAFAGLRPDAPLRATPTGDGWLLEGASPFVTGWGLADLVHTAVRTPDDEVVWLLVDATECDTLTVEPLPLLAVNASATVTARFHGHHVAADRETHRFPWAAWPAMDAAGLRNNGSLAVGVAERCVRLLGEPASLVHELTARTAALDANDPATLPEARAAASAFAHRVATALVVERGSGAVVSGTMANRLLREATVLLVFGGRPSIKDALLPRFT
ncbi:MAG TPA: acyl-CoA dehydrogenase family protein [Acidimicrobiales bacterium]|nr:acyl-CoA dehydrogenase family protein [Acidimicrobiales bacterium]